MQCKRGLVQAFLAMAIGVIGGCSDSATNIRTPPKPYYSAVQVGDFFSCAITTAGPTECWGANQQGQLGRGVTSDSSSTPIPVATSAAFVQISVGQDHSCGLDRAGAAYCWGLGALGLLGTGTENSAPAPARVATSVTFSGISAGAFHTCGLDTGGFAWCWGMNVQGQLGSTGAAPCRIGGALCNPAPAPVSGQIRFLSISAGGLHTCGVADTRDAYCWGYGGNGQLGNGSFQSSNAPILVKGGLKFATVVAGMDASTTCGLTGDGMAYCWGFTIIAGLLRQAVALPTLVPSKVSLKQLSAAYLHACGIATSGGAYCWGNNYNSTIGTASHDEPTAIAAGFNLTSISTSYSHTCGLDDTGEVYCWGHGLSGELGPGPKVSTQAPVRVIHP